MRVLSSAFLMVAICASLGSCATAPTDPLATMLDHEASYSSRRVAARQAHAQLRDDDRYVHTLRQIIFDAGYPTWQRIDAVEAYRRARPQEARHELAVRIMQLPDRAVAHHVIQHAAASGWREYTGPIVRRWLRVDPQVRDADRIERAALKQLHPQQPVEQVLFDVFADREKQWTLSHHIAAWEVLNRINAEAARRMLLQSHAYGRSSPAKDIHRGLQELHVLPRTREEILWLMHLGEEDRRPLWQQAATLTAQLDADQRNDLQLRHLPVILATGHVRVSRRALLDEIESSLTETHRAELHDIAQRPRAWGERLSWGDLLVIHAALEALRDEQVVAALFRQADADLQDTRTEYGGVILRDADGWRAQMHMPVQMRGDHVFVPPQPMIEQLYTGHFHYHFHAQKYDNVRHAAPGRGDLAKADRLNFNFLVFTFIDADRLNADYYQRGRVVVDLGVIRRPEK